MTEGFKKMITKLTRDELINEIVTVKGTTGVLDFYFDNEDNISKKLGGRFTKKENIILFIFQKGEIHANRYITSQDMSYYEALKIINEFFDAGVRMEIQKLPTVSMKCSTHKVPVRKSVTRRNTTRKIRR